MTRPPNISLALFAVILAVSMLFGNSGTNAGSTTKKIRIIYTNDTIGYLEPCGCGGRYEGGLARRATAIAQLTKENPNCVSVDSGNLSDTAAKLEIVTSTMSKMKYDAIGIGEVDRGFLKEFRQRTSENGLTVLDATNDAPESAVPYLIKLVNEMRVGIISYGVESRASNPLTLSDRKSFYSAYHSARSKSDVLVLLDQGKIATKDWLDSIGSRLGTPDIVIAGASNISMVHEDVQGTTHIVPTSAQGKFIGVIDINASNGKPLEMSARKIAIDKSIGEDEAVKKQISDFVLRSKQPVQVATSISAHKDQAAVKGRYYPPEFCKSCHPDEYEDWSKSKHANALRTLKSKNRLVPECLQCHSQDYRHSQKLPEDVNKPGGVDCCTCHSGALPHGMEGPPAGARKVDAKACLVCHTAERSPAYEESAYMRNVAHGIHREASSK